MFLYHLVGWQRRRWIGRVHRSRRDGKIGTGEEPWKLFRKYVLYGQQGSYEKAGVPEVEVFF
ncbi:hypothetical protein HRbin36_02305 [bacterium HR36]|nr:hypothetical protein HRbin36_02305 [bacterium HR36]